MKFSDFGLSEPLLRAVDAAGYQDATPIQASAIPLALVGRDLVGLAQTGTGKTAAFGLPLLHRLSQTHRPQGRGAKIRALILSPTRELAQQIATSLDEYGRHTGLRTAVVVGGVGMGPQIRALARGVEILVATPGRLEDLRRQSYVDLSAVEIFVLDEADRMLDVGFLPDIQRVARLLPVERQTMLFSATMPNEIRQLAERILRNPARVEVAPAQATTQLISESVCFVPQANKPRLLAAILQRPEVTRALVFTRTKHGADRVAKQLLKVGMRAEAIHGNKSQAARQRSLANFRSVRPPVLVATDLAARGLDVDGVSHVINFDLPMEPESYVHRIGRTGRAGATGVAIAFCDAGERKLLKAIERLLRRAVPVDQEAATSIAQHAPSQVPSESPRQPDSGRPQEGRHNDGRHHEGRGHNGHRPNKDGQPHEPRSSSAAPTARKAKPFRRKKRFAASAPGGGHGSSHRRPAHAP